MTAKRSISHKIALLGGEDYKNEYGRFTLYTVDGQNILLSYSELSPTQIAATEKETAAMVITRKKWGWNMTKQWQQLRERILWLVENTTIYVVVHHFPQAYNIEAVIIPVRLNSEASVGKNKGLPFRSIGEAVQYCNNNNIKIRP